MIGENLKKNSLDIKELYPQEKELIYYIRHKFKYGDIVIQTRAGLPYRILKVTEFQTLDDRQ